MSESDRSRKLRRERELDMDYQSALDRDASPKPWQAEHLFDPEAAESLPAAVKVDEATWIDLDLLNSEVELEVWDLIGAEQPFAD